MAFRDTHAFGAEEIIANFTAIFGNLKKTAVRNAMREAATVIRDEARRRVPERTGALRKAIIATTARSKRNKLVPYIGIVKVAKVAFARKASGKLRRVDRRKETGQGRVYNRGDIYPRNYDHLVEFGTAPHNLYKFRGGTKMHPGARAKPYFYPAYFAKRDQAVEVFARRLAAEAFRGLRKSSGRGSRKAAIVP